MATVSNALPLISRRGLIGATCFLTSALMAGCAQDGAPAGDAENLEGILSIGVLFLIDRFLLGNLRFRRDLPEEKAEKAGSDSFRRDAEAACEEISASRTDR